MTSHREAPKISQDPVADNTDVYAFVSPDRPDSVTLITNYIPLEEPAGGPNFHQFGDDVLYEILIDNNGDSVEDITYQFRFSTEIRNPDTFLYNTGPIDSLDDPDWNMRQSYSVTRVMGLRRSGEATVLARGLACPPARIGPRSTPSYETLANAAIHSLDGGLKVFAGQRDESFFVDLGAIFDLGTSRPLQEFHLIPTPAAAGVDATKGYNVHTVAIQVPKTQLTRDASNPADPMDARSVIGVWASASRQKARILPSRTSTGTPGVSAGPFIQVSRLGNPLINELFIPLGKKDSWNASHPSDDKQFAQYYVNPEPARLLRLLYPAALPNVPLPPDRPRNDIVAALLTGIPSGLIPGFQNFTGQTQADMIRLNIAIPPSNSPNRLGLIGGDPAGFPNGRRIDAFDDIVDIYLRVAAGAVYPLIDPTFTPDGAVGLLGDGLQNNDIEYLNSFPYLAHPHEGYEHHHD